MKYFIKNSSKIIGILFLIIFVSCQGKDKFNKTDKQIILDLQGKEVLVPWEKMHANFNGTQLEFKAISQKQIKIVSLINTSCPACLEDIKKWSHFIQGVDTMYTSFIFLFYSSDQFISLNEDSMKINLMYPYFKDINNEIIKMNKFPVDKKYQTFLINSKNQIVLVGSPNQNETMFNLYRDYIDRYFQERNISGAVKGAIIIQEGNKIKTRFATAPKYFLENGEPIEENKANEMIKSNEYYPSINTLTSEVTIIKRK